MSDTTGDTFMQALTDPRLDALLGMTQGFAQAAMPTRMPTPFGAVLGMGAGGAMQGVKQGQALAMGAQQLQQAQIANQRAGMLMDAYKQMYGGGGAPFGAPVARAGQSPLPGAASSGQPGYLTSPQQLKMLADLAMATGQDRAAATLYNMPNTMAGGAGYSMGANGQAFPTPGGAADPRMVAAIQAAKTFAEKNTAAPYEQPVSVDVPQLGPDGQPTGNVVKQQIPLPQWAAQNGSAAGSGAPLQPNALPADPFPGWAKKINAGESGGDPNAANPNSTASGPGQFLNGTWPSVLRATRPDIAAGHTDAELMPLRNIPALADSATEAYARMNGGILAQKGLPVDGSTVALAHAFGPGGASTILQAQPNAPLAMLPGMAPVIAANPQLKGATAGQVTQMYQARMNGGQPPQYGGQVTLSPQNQAALQLQTDRAKLITTRAGVVDPTQIDPATGMAKEIYRQPEYHELQDPQTGAEYPSFVQPGANGQLLVSGGPPGMGGQLPPSRVGPGQEDAIKHLADQYANEDKQKYEGATNSLFQLGQQDKNIAALNAGGGWSATGAGADAKMQWAKGINSAFQTMGIAPPFDPSKVASWEDATKIQTQLAFAQAKQLGSHEAQQVISMSRAATPGAENTPEGYQAISSGYHEMNNREVDLYNYKTDWLQNHGGNLTGAETAFNNQFTPAMYAERARSTVDPFPIKSQDQASAMQEMQQYLPGTMIKLPNGKTSIVPPRPGMPPVPGYIQNYVQGGANAP